MKSPLPQGGTSSARWTMTPPKRAVPRLSLTRPALAGLLALTLVAGAAGGALVMRQRAHALDALVSVNGVVIRRADYEARLDTATRGAVLHQMIDEELQTQYARRKGLLPGDAAVQARYALLAAAPGFAARSASLGLTPDAVRGALRVSLAREALAAQGAVPTESQMKDFYRRNADPANPQARFYAPETVSVSVIVTPTEEEGRKARALLDTGVAFSDVALQYSHDLSRRAGGTLPPVARGRTRAGRVPGLEPALFALAPGQTSGPDRIGGLWWVIRCLSRTPAAVRPYADVRDDCRAALAAALGQARSGRQEDADYARFARGASIRVFDPRVGPLLPQATQ